MNTAEQTTQTPAEQPIQQTQQPKETRTELSALEKAKLADTRQPIKLDTIEAYDELEVFDTEEQTSTNGTTYWRMRFRGAIVTVTPEFKTAFDNSKLISVIATPTVYELDRPDPDNAGKTKKVIFHGWALSFTDVAKRNKAVQAKNAAAQVQMKMILQDKKTEQTLKAIEATDIKFELNQADIDALIADL